MVRLPFPLLSPIRSSSLTLVITPHHRALPIFEKIFTRPTDTTDYSPIRLTTIWFGANDACLPQRTQHLPLEKYKSNLSHYISSLLTPSSPYYQPHTRIILITPPPIVPSQRNTHQTQSGNAHLPPDREIEHSRKYKQACLDVGKEWMEKEEGKGKVGVVDAWEVLVTDAGGEGDVLIPYFRQVIPSINSPSRFDPCFCSDPPHSPTLLIFLSHSVTGST